MEGKESEHKDSNHGEPSESREKFMERMERRHRNAVTIFEIERILSPEEPVDEYPSTTTPENIRKRRETEERLRPILDILSIAGLVERIERIKEAVGSYFVEKVNALRVELQLKEKLKSEDRKTTPQEIGLELFRQRTGEDPKKPVEAVRREGFFVLAFFHDDDYLRFIEDSGIDESAGSFHRAMRFSNMTVDVVLSKYGFGNRTLLHERQHFINSSILGGFDGIEDTRTVQKSNFPLLAEGVIQQKSEFRENLRAIKDELLARIRDGADRFETTNFFDTDLYSYLRDEFSEDEQVEVRSLLKKIEIELDEAFKFFDYPLSRRGILVYHLIDAPLLLFPARIKGVVDFYNAKIQEFTIFIPDGLQREQVSDRRKRIRLLGLSSEITGNVYEAIDFIMGAKNTSYDATQEELRRLKDKIEKLRKDYDALI